MNTPSDTSTEPSASLPAATGGRFGTVTVNVCNTLMFEPPTSVAVTVIVAVPAESGVSVSVDPDIDADTTAGADETAA